MAFYDMGQLKLNPFLPESASPLKINWRSMQTHMLLPLMSKLFGGIKATSGTHISPGRIWLPDFNLKFWYDEDRLIHVLAEKDGIRILLDIGWLDTVSQGWRVATVAWYLGKGTGLPRDRIWAPVSDAIIDLVGEAAENVDLVGTHTIVYAGGGPFSMTGATWAPGTVAIP